MNEQHCKSGLQRSIHQSSLTLAKNNLKTYIDRIKFTNGHGGSLTFYSASPNYSNVWEGETGMMEHIHSPFPMPPKESMLVDQQNQDDMSATPTVYGHGQNRMETNVNPGCNVTDIPLTSEQEDRFQTKAESMMSILARPTTSYPSTPSSQPSAVPTQDGLSIDTDIVMVDADNDVSLCTAVKLTKTSMIAKKSKAKRNDKNNDNNGDSNYFSTVTQKRQFLVDLARQDVTKTAALYNRKIEEWKKILSGIEQVFNRLQTALTSVYQCKQYPEMLYKSWRQVCFLIECLHGDMEMERMALLPDNTFCRFIFPLDLRKNIKKTQARVIQDNFQHIKSAMHSMAKHLKKIYNGKMDLFRKYNAEIKDCELKITVPVLFLLHKQTRYFKIQQGKPFISLLTPGMTAGVYGKEKSIQDRYLRWLGKTCESPNKKILSDTDSNKKCSVNMEQCNSRDSHLNTGLNNSYNCKLDLLCTDKSDIVTLSTNNTGDRRVVTGLPDAINAKQDDKGCKVNSITQTGAGGMLNAKMAVVPISHIIDHSLCLITEYDEHSLKACRIDVPNFCTEFENMYLGWKSKAQGLESILKKVDREISFETGDIILNPGIESACTTLSRAYSSLQSLYIEYACAKLSQRAHNATATWKFSRSVCAMIDNKIKDSLSNKFNRLYRDFKRVGRICRDMWNRHEEVIQLYNVQAKETNLVRLPMQISFISEKVRDLIRCGSIPKIPLIETLCQKEKMATKLNSHTQASPNMSLTNDVDKGDYCESTLDRAQDNVTLPKAGLKNQNSGKKEKQDLISVFVREQQTLIGLDLYPNSLLNKEQDINAFSMSEGQSVSELVENIRSCDCGCQGVSMFNKAHLQSENGSSGENLKLLQQKIVQVKYHLSEAEVNLRSCETAKHTACKLFVDIGATLPYLQAGLNIERAEKLKHCCTGASSLEEEEMEDQGFINTSEGKADIFSVEQVLASLFKKFDKILSENREIIQGIFPHAESFKIKRGDFIQFFAPPSTGKLSKHHIRKMKREAGSANAFMKRVEFTSYNRLRLALFLLKESRNRLSNIISCIAKPNGTSKFEAQKSSQKCMLNLYQGLEKCLEQLRPRPNMSLRDYQMKEIPQDLHSVFQNEKFEESVGVYVQARILLQKYVIAFECLKKKLSPSFIQSLGVIRPFVDP